MSEEKYEIVKFIDGELELDVNVNHNDETIWLNQTQIALLFCKSKSTINEHIKNILEKELDEKDVVRKFGKTELSNVKTKPILFYNLDLVLAVGYKVNSKRGIEFRKWASKVLKEYLLKGYVINENRVIVSNENYIDLRNEVSNINNRLIKLEDKVFDKEYGLNKILYDGQFYDAYTLIQQIFESANNEIIIIDNYVDRTVLDRLIVKKNNVKVTIYTSITSRLLGKDIDFFNKQYGKLEVKYTTKVHDRYIIIDQTKLYHLGHSIKDLGKKICSISESDSLLIKKLINNLEQIN